MKKIVLWIVAALLVVGASIAALMLRPKEGDVEVLSPIEDPLFVYVNLEQLAAKGAFDSYITPGNRSFIASVLSSQLEDIEKSEHLRNIVSNIDVLGLDIHKHIYGYLNNSLTEFAIVVDVLDVAQVDCSVTLLSYFLEQNGEDAIEVIKEDDIRLFEYNGVAVAYNDRTFAVAFGADNANLAVAKEALARPKFDMSIFGVSDLAVLINTGKCAELANAKIEEATLALEMEYNNGDIDTEEYHIENRAIIANSELVSRYASYFESDSNILLSTTFDLGRMTLAYSSQGINFGEYAAMCKPTGTTHLGNLSVDTYAVMSAGVDGELLSKFVRSLLSGDMLRSVGITPTNEVNMFVSIACDALSTIDGDVTLALEDIDGEIKSRYNYYWDEYYIEPSIKSVKAMLMADVTDTYIISNIAQFAGGFLRKVDATHYTLRLMNYNLSMGQDENLFHLGVNMSPELQTLSALDSAWAKDVEGAMAYAVVNVDALMASKFMKSTNKYVATQLLEEYRELYSRATEMVSYAYVAVDALDVAEVVVVFDDQSLNALEQINALILPTLVQTSVKSLF